MKVTIKTPDGKEQTFESIYIIATVNNGDSFLIRGGERLDIIKDAPKELKVIPSSFNSVKIE